MAPSVPLLVPLEEVAIQHRGHWVSHGLCAPLEVPEVRGNIGAAIGC